MSDRRELRIYSIGRGNEGSFMSKKNTSPCVDNACGSADKKINSRLGCIGGQAVLEGIMMKCKGDLSIAVRRYDGDVVVRTKKYKTAKERSIFFRIPLIRGCCGFVDSLITSFSTLTASTDMLGLEEMGEPGKVEKWLTKVFGKSITAIISAVSVVLGVALALGLFVWLPTFIVGLLKGWLGFNSVVQSALEGVLKIAIFIAYIGLTALIPDIKRTYQYHGAEHKTIFCYESGEELTVQNVKKQKRLHPRCGTAFMFVILILSIFVTAAVPWNAIYDAININATWIRVIGKIILLPIVVGIGYEFIMYAGKHDNLFTKICSAPGLWMQKITTKEPDDDQIEVAIISVKSVLREEYPDFIIPYEKTAEEKAEEAKVNAEDSDSGEESVG